jgi:DNA-binding NtrC family response regulator
MCGLQILDGTMSRFPEIPEELTIDETINQPSPADTVPSVSGTNGDEPVVSLRSVRVRVEIEAIRSALRRTGWNRKQAARLLKISYRGLLYKIRQYDITAA